MGKRTGQKLMVPAVQPVDETIEQIYDRKNNAFDLLRFILAAMVIYDHSYATLRGPGREDLLGIWTGGQINCGSLAVDGFLIISGFLVTQSMLNSKSYGTYLVKRLLRILPAFFMSLFLISFVLGPLVTHMDLSSYFHDGGNNGPFSFILKNITFNVFGYSWTVQDVFANSIYPGSANGSMWTLKDEFACYLMVMLLSCFYFFRHRVLTLLFTLFTGFLLILNYLNGFCLTPFVNRGWILSRPEYPGFIRICFFFTAGVCIYMFRDKIHFHPRWIFLAAAVLLASIKMHVVLYALMLFLPYLIISVGTKFRLSFLRKYGDFSYGMYIYAFPVQQVVSLLWAKHLNIPSFFLISFFFTLCISVLSWKFIENPALQLKKRL